MKKSRIIWLTGIVVLALFYWWVFTRPFNEYTSLKDGAPIGDAINGLTTPIIGLLGSILVYLSFREQVKANRIQVQSLNEQRELDLFYKFYEELKSDLQKIQSEYGTRYKQPSVLDSMMNYLLNDGPSPYDELHEYIQYIFNQFTFLGKRINRAKNLNDSEVVYLIEKTIRLYDLYFKVYYNKFFSRLFESESTQSFKKSFEKIHKLILELEKLHREKKESLRKQSVE